MGSFVVVVLYEVFDVGECSCCVFCFVGEEPAFYFAVGLWSVDSGNVVFDA